MSETVGICGFCQRDIVAPTGYTTVDGKNYHEQCWACNCCKKPIVGGFAWSDDMKPWCNDCYDNNLAVKCVKCRGIIEGDYINKDGPTHSYCFCCDRCGKSIGAEQYYPKDGRSYCTESCLNDANGGAQPGAPKPQPARAAVVKMDIVTDPCNICKEKCFDMDRIDEMDRIYHKKCFKCGNCGKTLERNNYIGQDKVPYCSQHVPKAVPTSMPL